MAWSKPVGGDTMERSMLLSFHAATLPAFVNPPDDRYVCAKCNETLRPPVSQASCGHRMCEVCVGDMFQSEASVDCPGDDDDCEKLTRQKLHPDRATSKELQKMLVYCSNRRLGCEVIEKWLLINAHEIVCLYQEIHCPNHGNGCTSMILLKDKENHLIQCEFSLEHCGICDKDIPKSEMRRGHIERCRLKPQKCILNIFGCTFVAPSDEHKEHLIACVISHSKEMGRYFEQQKSDQIEAKENMSNMQRALENLQKMVDSLKRGTSSERAITPLQTSVDKLTDNLNSLKLKVDQSTTAAQLQSCADKVQQVQQLSSAHESRITQLEQGGTGVSGNSRDLVEKVSRLETSVNMHDIRFAESDLRFRLLETAAFEGRLIWRIPSYARRKQDAVEGRTLSLYSQPFYSSYYGYKMCARVYLNGDGLGKGSHLSLFFVLMKGEYDALLQWPYRQRVTISVLDQSGNRKHITDTFRPDPTSTSFRKPMGEMNIASGSPLFAPHAKVESDPYLRDDTLFVCITIDKADLPEPWV